MKVIKNNNPTYQIICPHCKSILEYDHRDIYSDWGIDDGEFCIYRRIFCPCCDKIITLSVDDKPFDCNE